MGAVTEVLSYWKVESTRNSKVISPPHFKTTYFLEEAAHAIKIQ